MKQIIKVYHDHIEVVEFCPDTLTMCVHLYTPDTDKHLQPHKFNSEAAFALAFSIVSFSSEKSQALPPHDKSTWGGFLQP